MNYEITSDKKTDCIAYYVDCCKHNINELYK